MNLSDGDLADMKEVAQQSQVEGKACLVSPAVLLALVEEAERNRQNVSKPIITNNSVKSPCCGASGIQGRTGYMPLHGPFRVEYTCSACGKTFTVPVTDAADT